MLNLFFRSGQGVGSLAQLMATTRTAAASRGWQDHVGTLAAGKLADVVIRRTDPLVDIRCLAEATNIVCSIQNGKDVKDFGGAA